MTEIMLAAILPGRRKGKSDEMGVLVEKYLARGSQYMPCGAGTFESEEALLAGVARQAGRTAAQLILFDPRGQMVKSEGFAAMLKRMRDEGAQRIVLAIGPADGWSETARGRAAAMVSFGRITLPHDLARVVAAEQIYRALTIVAGHPYHCGH